MRHIKLFENFEKENLRFKFHEDKLRTDIDGIFVELLDKGFNYSVYFKEYLEINIEHSVNDWFFFDEIYEELMMLIDYMNIKFKNDIDFKYNYEEHFAFRGYNGNKNNTTVWSIRKQKVMMKEDKHVLMSYFELDIKLK
jgi:hypothetical protein